MSTRAVPFGKYHLLERINVGGMAEVYKAKMIGVEGFEKLLAIKRILPAIAADKDFINMFIDEAKISVQLNHANIAQTFELGRLNETYFIAMEYVPGRDLRAVFERLRRRGEVVPAEVACYVMSRVAEGLDYAHRKKDVIGRDLGIIHRDISPQNVLVSYEGEVKIIDFGIAKAANKIMKTQAGILKGKFGYMSPEQVRGLPLDRRSDIFAAGIVLYELLVGDRLFTGESDYSILEKVRSANIPRLSAVRKGVPAPLEKIVARALTKEPDERYQHASELVADLQRYLLAQEKLFTREDLGGFLKTLFPEDFEREKRSFTDAGLGDDAAGAVPASEPSQSVPAMRPSMRDSRPRLEGGSARPLSPPPPPADAFVGPDEPPERGRSLQPLRPGRLAGAAQAAETDKINLHRTTRLAEEDTTTETAPDAQIAAMQRRARAGGGDDESTPTPEDVRFRSELPMTDLPTRIGRTPAPPPIASQPPGKASSMPPARNLRLPAITDNMPPPGRRPPPPVSDDDSDELTVLEQSNFRPRRPAAAPSKTSARPLSPRPVGKAGVTPPAPAPGQRSIGDDEDESTLLGSRAKAYQPRRKQSWAIVPIAGIAALAIAFGVLKWRGTSFPGDDENLPARAAGSTAPASDPAAAPLATLTVVTDPADAQVWLNEKSVKIGGDKPWVGERLAVGVAFVVVARKDGFRQAATSVTLQRGVAREIQLKLKAKGATVILRTNPPGALLSVDGSDVGRAPETIGTLEPGPHRVRAELKCFESVEREILVGESEQTIELELKPSPGACLSTKPKGSEPGLLRLLSRPPARVFIDGHDIQRETPLIDLPLSAGRHAIRLVSDGRSEEFDVEIAAGRPLTKIVVLR